MKASKTRLIYWSKSRSVLCHKGDCKNHQKLRPTTLRMFLQEILANEHYCVFPASENLKHPKIRQFDAGVELSSNGEKLLIGRVTKKCVFVPTLWFTPWFWFKREYEYLTVVAIATEKVEHSCTDEHPFARVEWLDQDFYESCTILWENRGRTFFLLSCSDFSDRVLFSMKYSWNSITKMWDEIEG